ncbi:diguanylate cyclase domain-containing protein [Eleftheria terrae]|uniref:diguanylate cyclase domain-containing protein n=1 Tax=Eleftheria terrae TaxID=1597781 RepID=UPI00263A983D|nr:diguanylate cyclase [Eleftheria terrae]WKB54200.1 diguanylate cyclase [Eleftheria terrae]
MPLLLHCLLSVAVALGAWLWAPAFADTPPLRWERGADAVFQRVQSPAAALANAIVQDRDGFLWIGGQAGLSRWDGYRFRTYTGDAGRPGALPDSFIHALHVDPQGTLWVGTSAGGLARYDAAQDRFVVYPAAAGNVAGAAVYAIEGDGAGGLWLGTGAGLAHLDPGRGHITPHAGAAGPGAGPVQALLRDRAGALWAGTRHGLWRRLPRSERYSLVPLPTEEGPAPAVTRLMQDSAGRVWAGTRPHGAFVIEPGPGTVRAVRESGNPGAAGLHGDTVFAMLETVPGEVWLGTDGGGIVRVDTHAWQTRRLLHHAGLSSSLPDNDISALFRDRSGLIWVGSDTALSSHDPRQRAVSTWFGGTGASGVSHANVPFLLPLPDGRVWLSVGDGGVDIMDPLKGRIGQLRPDSAHPRSALPKGRVLAMVRGPLGEVYLGTQQGLYLADAQGLGVRRLDIEGRPPGAAVWALCFDAGRLWAGGLDGLWGLDVARPDRPRVVAREDATRLGEPRVTSLTAGPGRLLWIGTRAGLLSRDHATGALQRPAADRPDRIGLPAGYMTTVLTDRQGRLWVGSFGAGIRVVDGRHEDGTPRVRRIGIREGLPDNGVNRLLLDARGDIWASTDDGLAHIDQRTLAVRALRSDMGVGIGSYWTNAGALTATGELLFGGIGGLTVVRPEHLLPPSYLPPVVVTELRAGQQPRLVGAAQHTGRLAPVQLEAEQRSLLVEFAALDYAAPHGIRYAYRLLGFDKEWVATEPSRRLAAYTNLPPGDYRLQLRAASRGGDWTPALELPVRVQPAWHQTHLFRGMAVLLGLALLLGGLQLRTVYFRRRQQQLQALVAERTAALEQRSAELRASQQLLEQMAYADVLTGLANRRRFTDELRRHAAPARAGEGCVLMLIDLDRFKLVNDTLGHDAGDALLVEVAARLARAVPAPGCVARLGGDEFAVLLPAAAAQAAEAVCRRVLQALLEPMSFQGHRLSAGASIGLARCPEHGEQADALYKAADLALYEAKRAGRNTWRWHAAPWADGAAGVLPQARAVAA